MPDLALLLHRPAAFESSYRTTTSSPRYRPACPSYSPSSGRTYRLLTYRRVATDTRLQSSYRGYTNGDLLALSRAWIFDRPYGQRLLPVLLTGYRKLKAARNA